jgi:hypothetical protein
MDGRFGGNYIHITNRPIPTFGFSKTFVELRADWWNARAGWRGEPFGPRYQDRQSGPSPSLVVLSHHDAGACVDPWDSETQAWRLAPHSLGGRWEVCLARLPAGLRARVGGNERSSSGAADYQDEPASAHAQSAVATRVIPHRQAGRVDLMDGLQAPIFPDVGRYVGPRRNPRLNAGCHGCIRIGTVR